MAAIVTSPAANVNVPNTFEGVYINIVTGATGVSAAGTPGWDFNPYGTASGLGIFWAAAPAGGVGTTAATGPLLVLAPGATIGPTSIFTRSIQATNPNWRQTVDGFLGLAFVNEATGATNYGYARMTTTATTGFPAVVVSIVYENTGQPITIPLPGTPPIFAYNPAAGGTVPFTGGAGVGSTANGSIAVTIGTAGSGTGAAATTTTTCTAPTAPFAGFGQTVTAVGAAATTTGGPLSGTCTVGAAAVTQTLTCSENRGGTPTARTFTLSCPAGTQPPVTSTPPSGGTVTLPTQSAGGPATTATISFQNPGSLATSVTCTAPTATQFTVNPLVIALPALGSGSTTVTFSSGASGSFTGTLNCTSAGGTAFTFTLRGTTAAVIAVPGLDDQGRLLLVLVLLGIGLVAVGVRRT